MKHLTENHKKVLFLALLLLGCQKSTISETNGVIIPINSDVLASQEYENYIEPFRNHINRDLDSVLSYAPENMDRANGKWQTTLANFLADSTLEKADQLFYEKHKKNVDLCILNFGGIRSPIAKGNVTSRTAYQIMPFENSLVVAELKAEQIIELVTYFVQEKKAHPISGVKIELSKDEKSYEKIFIRGKLLDLDKTYFVATSDYLFAGGDRMNFFKKATNMYETNYKLRNLLIDYFKETDTISIVLDDRIIEN